MGVIKVCILYPYFPVLRRCSVSNFITGCETSLNEMKMHSADHNVMQSCHQVDGSSSMDFNDFNGFQCYFVYPICTQSQKASEIRQANVKRVCNAKPVRLPKTHNQHLV